MGDIGQMGAAGISAAANLAATSASNSANVSMNNATNETSRQIANENNQTQIAMQRENNQFNHNEAELANARMIEQWERESRYNSPIEQIKRLEAAGLNPQLAYGGSSVNNVGAPSHGGSQASAASSGISPSMPVLRPGHIDPYLPGSDFANLAKAFADAKKTGAEGDLAIRGMNYALRNMKANAELADMASTFERIYGGAMRDKKLALLGEDVLLKTEELYNLKKEGKLTEAKTLLTEIQQTTEKMEGRLKKFLGDTDEQRSKTFMSKLRADINLENAQAASAWASANLSKEQAQTISDIRVNEVELKKQEAEWTKNKSNLTLEEIKNQPEIRSRLAKECVLLTKQIVSQQLSNEQETILTGVYNKMLEQDLKKTEKEIRQMGQDYWNPIRYVGTLFGGAAAGVAAQGMRQNAGQRIVVSGFK